MTDGKNGRALPFYIAGISRMHHHVLVYFDTRHTSFTSRIDSFSMPEGDDSRFLLEVCPLHAYFP